MKKHKLISLQEAHKILGYSKKELAEIDKRARSIIAAMEIREMRKKLGITQKELAKKTGIHRTTISKIERGWRDIPVSKLVEVARAMGKKVELRFV